MRGLGLKNHSGEKEGVEGILIRRKNVKHNFSPAPTRCGSLWWRFYTKIEVHISLQLA